VLNLLGLVVASYILVLVTWLFYLAIMHLRMVRHDLHPVAKANAYVLLAIGLVLDFITNVVVGSVLFLDPPREWLLTDRLQRYKNLDRESWRGKTAYWLCEHLLNQFDEGHC